GWQELVIVMVIVMIIFGAGKLPDVAKSLGQGVREFKSEAEGGLTSDAGAAAANPTAALNNAAADLKTATNEAIDPARI
ncbi:MAG: twin-arginine translocase TatA/TatE family subunit, partial [Thermomicrobiales bacterium]